jgi:hypothetical protein
MMSLAYAFSVLSVFTTFAAAPGPGPAVRAEGPVVVVGVFSDKIGVKPMPSSPLELELGHSFTASVVDGAKLVKYGIVGMHEGARVTVTRIAADKLRVEAEEMEPIEHKEIVTLLINGDGTYTPVSKKG